MAKRRKRQSGLESLILLMMFFTQVLIITLFRHTVFIYDLITFFTSKYKEKSGNTFIKTYFDKGHYGEFLLYRKVIKVFGKESVLTNIYLDHKNTELTEIDVIAISEKGIYIFEMKNYAGYIYGSEKDKTWTQVLNKWSKHQFYNPLKQNYAHTKAVEHYLNISNDNIISMIVFSNRSKLNKIHVSEDKHVYQFKDALKTIKRYEKIAQSKLSLEQKQDYLTKLLDRCHMTKEVKKRHIENVQSLLTNKELTQ